MAEVAPAILVPGIRQDQDRALLPPGSLVLAENARVRKGALVRRPPMAAQPTAVAQYLNIDESNPQNAASAVAGPPISGYAGELAEVGGRQVLIAGGRAYQSNGGAWVEGGRPSRALPVEAKWVSYDSAASQPGGADIPNGIGKVACATLSAYTAVTYERIDASGIGQCVLIVYDRAGTVVAEYLAGQPLSLEGRLSPRIISAGAFFYWFYQDDGSSGFNYIYVRKVDPTLRTISAETQLTQTKAVGDGYDAVAYKGGTEVLVVRRLTIGEAFEVARYTAGVWGAQLASRTHNLGPDGLSGNFLPTVYGDDAGSQIWVALAMIDSSDARAIGYDGALAAEVSNFSLTSPIAGYSVTEFLAFAMPTVTARANGSAWCAVTFFRQVGGSSMYRTVLYQLDLGGSAFFQPATMLNIRAGSRLFGGTTTSVRCWLHTDNGLLASEVGSPNSYAWRNQRRYCLSTIVLAKDGSGDLRAAVVQPELIPDERASSYMRGWLPEVATRFEYDDNGNGATHGFVPLLVPVLTTDGDNGKDSLAVVFYEWEDADTQTSTARRLLEHASGVLIVGGGLQELPADISNRNVARFGGGAPTPEIADPRGFQNGFLLAPAVIQIVTSDDPTANLTPSGVYQFCAVYEHVDDSGRRHLSAVSNFRQVTAPDATTQFSIQVSKPPFTEREMASVAHRSVVHIFATVGNGSTFYRVTPNAGAPGTWDNQNTFVATFIFTGWTDAAIQRREILYTFGGVKPNRPAPAHRFGARGNGRVVLGGLFDPRLIEVSKIERQQLPTQFTREDAFRTMLPERCTGLAFLDGSFVAFTRRAVYLISGSNLPDDKGSPSVPNPVRLPSTVGCIDWRSVVEVPDGVVFQSERGVYLLPRGFGQPVLISGQVQDSLQGRRVVSACVVGDPGSDYAAGLGEPVTPVARAVGQHLLVLSVVAPDSLDDAEKGRLLVFDLDRRIWVSVDDPGATTAIGAIVANLGGKLAVASRSQATPDIRLEVPGQWEGDPLNPPMRLSLADLRPFGVLTQGRMLRVQVLGEVRSDRSKLALAAAVDGKYSAPRALTPLTVRGAPGDKFVVEWSLPVRQVTALGLELTVTDGGVAGEGLALQAVGVEVLPPGDRARVGQSRRAA